jgi:O-antigen/teichoic acid export membrane protein
MLFNRLSKSPFIKNVLTIAGGTGFAQVISIFTAPIITRIYTPEDYGILGIYMMFTGIIGTISTLKLANAIIVEKDDKTCKKGSEIKGQKDSF